MSRKTQHTPSILSAEWTNQRLLNVLDKIDTILDRIYEGFLSSGYLPLEQPITKALLAKMTPEQVLTILSSLPTNAERFALLKLLDLSAEELYDMLEQGSPTPEKGVA